MEFYIALIKQLGAVNSGKIHSWLGEKQCKFKFIYNGKRVKLNQDAFCFWVFHQLFGAFFLEWERGFHTITDLADKLDRYDHYYETQAFLDQIGPIGIIPRLAFVFPTVAEQTHFGQFVMRQQIQGRWQSLPTVLVGVKDQVVERPLANIWLKPGQSEPGLLCA
jgi:hypothetical protein